MLFTAACATLAWSASLFTDHLHPNSYKQSYACRNVTVTLDGGFWSSVLVSALSIYSSLHVATELC